MLRAFGASAVAFCTFFISPVNASYDQPVEVREVVSASWDVAEVSEQLAAAAAGQGYTELAQAAATLHREATAWYAAVRRIGDVSRTLTPDEIPPARDEMAQAYDDLTMRMDATESAAGADSLTAELRTLWRLMQTRMHLASQVTQAQPESRDR